MDDANLTKQAYRGTGCERGSSEGVTVSIQGGKGGSGDSAWRMYLEAQKGRLDAEYRFSLNWKFDIRAQDAPEARVK